MCCNNNVVQCDILNGDISCNGNFIVVEISTWRPLLGASLGMQKRLEFEASCKGSLEFSEKKLLGVKIKSPDAVRCLDHKIQTIEPKTFSLMLYLYIDPQCTAVIIDKFCRILTWVGFSCIYSVYVYSTQYSLSQVKYQIVNCLFMICYLYL